MEIAKVYHNLRSAPPSTFEQHLSVLNLRRIINNNFFQNRNALWSCKELLGANGIGRVRGYHSSNLL
jgi:hypothetical protein